MMSQPFVTNSENKLNFNYDLGAGHRIIENIDTEQFLGEHGDVESLKCDGLLAKYIIYRYFFSVCEVVTLAECKLFFIAYST
jgi:hypothetical protein